VFFLPSDAPPTDTVEKERKGDIHDDCNREGSKFNKKGFYGMTSEATAIEGNIILIILIILTTR
jgi:hypothetical protein